MGIANRWIWPGGSLADSDHFYRGFGLVRSSDGGVSAWGHSASNMTHAAVSGPAHGPRWESKCGADLRIQHGLGELVGSTYGRVVAFYRHSPSLPKPFAATLEEMVTEKFAKSYLSAAQRRELARECDRIPSDLPDRFAVAFAAWKRTWHAGGLAISSNPHTRAVGREYDALIALGRAVLPLVVEQLTDPENHLALQLYDAMQPDDKLLVQFAPSDERILEGEQGRAKRVVQAWFANR